MKNSMLMELLPHMRKEFRVHPALFLVQQALFFAAYASIAACWIMPYLFEPPLREQFLRITLYLSLTILAGLFALKALFFEMAHTVYILTDDRLIRKSPSRTYMASLSEITGFDYRSVPTGHGIVRCAGKPMRLYLFMENVSELVHALEELVFSSNDTCSRTVRDLRRFSHNARITDVLLRHTYLIITPAFYLALLLPCISAIAAFFIWQLAAVNALLWICIGFMFPPLWYLCATHILARRMSPHLTQVRGSAVTPDAGGVYGVTALLLGALYLLCGILFKNLFL